MWWPCQGYVPTLRSTAHGWLMIRLSWGQRTWGYWCQTQLVSSRDEMMKWMSMGSPWEAQKPRFFFSFSADSFGGHTERIFGGVRLRCSSVAGKPDSPPKTFLDGWRLQKGPSWVFCVQVELWMASLTPRGSHGSTTSTVVEDFIGCRVTTARFTRSYQCCTWPSMYGQQLRLSFCKGDEFAKDALSMEWVSNVHQFISVHHGILCILDVLWAEHVLLCPFPWDEPIFCLFSCQVRCVPHADQCPSLHSSSLGQVAQRHHAGAQQRSLGDVVWEVTFWGAGYWAITKKARAEWAKVLLLCQPQFSDPFWVMELESPASQTTSMLCSSTRLLCAFPAISLHKDLRDQLTSCQAKMLYQPLPL